MRQIKFAFRTLLKTPVVTGIAILSLALGIGANAAVFTFFDQMLLRALPVHEPERLVNLVAPGPKPGSTSCNQAGSCEEVFSYPMFRDLEAMDGPFSGLAAHFLFGANLATEVQTIPGEGSLVSGSYFGVLGLTPVLGRLLQPADDRNIGEHFVTVLSHEYWENVHGSDPGVLNGTMVINGQTMTIVGVAPRGFRGTTLGAKPDVFVPLAMRDVMIPGWAGLEDRRAYWAYVFGRLAEGVDIEQAAVAINRPYRAILNEVEAPLQEEMSAATMERFRSKQITLEPGTRGQSGLHSEARAPILMLLGITGIVLLIACANIANLLLARGAHRAQEMAIRGSLGASRTHLFNQLITESVVLALLGGVASLLVASWTMALIGSFLPADALATLDLNVSKSVLGFTAALSVATGLLFGMYPAAHSTREDLVTMLKAGGGQPAGARAAARFRAALVTAQIALSMALLVTAGLFIKSLANISRIDLGLDTHDMVVFEISPTLNGYAPAESRALFERVELELSAIPGVTAVAAARVPVLGGSSWGTEVRVQGFEWGPDIDSSSRMNFVGPEFFSTLGMALLAGREFSASDAGDEVTVAIVNEAFTRKFRLDSRDAVGMRMSTGSDELDIEIVGVVADAKYAEVRDEIPPLFFAPYRQTDMGSMTFYMRTGMDPSGALRAVPAVIKDLDPNLPVEDLKTLEQQAQESLLIDRLIGTMSAAFAALATLLAGVGLYGVLAFTVAQRTREIGVRMALGAAAGRVQRMILRQVGTMTVVGGLIGIAAALLGGSAAQSLLYELDAFDPLVIAGVTALLVAVALGAGYMPARRASETHPMEALRYD
jgi:predicted permease